MRNGVYTAKRRSSGTSWRENNSTHSSTRGSNFGTDFRPNFTASGFSRNRNTVKHSAKSFGPVSTAFLFIGVAAILGLIYVSEGTKATSYDYELSSLQNQIEDLEAQRDDLAVEKARLNSIAQSEKSTVAASMETATGAGYAE